MAAREGWVFAHVPLSFFNYVMKAFFKNLLLTNFPRMFVLYVYMFSRWLYFPKEKVKKRERPLVF